MRRGLLLAASAILGTGGIAAAETPASVATVHLEVQAAPSCATRDALAALVAARSPRIRFRDDGAAVTSLRAEITPGPNDTVVGQLSIVDPGGRRSSRRLSAPTCAEAIDAIALIVVISLDPTYAPPTSIQKARGPGPVTPAPRAGPGTMGADRRPDAAPAPVRSREAPAGSPEASGEQRGPGGKPPRPTVRRLGVGAAAQLISGPAPRVMPGVAVRVFAALDRASIWSPALRLTAAHAWQNGVGEPGGTAAFALDTLGLDVCVIRLGIKIVELRGCAAATAGRLSATGSNTYSPSSQERPFVGVGGAAIVGVAIGPILQLSGTFGAGDALIRDAFEFSPQVFHRVSAMTLTVDLGLGLRFL